MTTSKHGRFSLKIKGIAPNKRKRFFDAYVETSILKTDDYEEADFYDFIDRKQGMQPR